MDYQYGIGNIALNLQPVYFTRYTALATRSKMDCTLPHTRTLHPTRHKNTRIRHSEPYQVMRLTIFACLRLCGTTAPLPQEPFTFRRRRGETG